MHTQEEQKNLAVVAEYFAEYWGKGNAGIVDKLCAENFVINYPMHGPRYGGEAAKKMLREFKEASPIPAPVPDVSFPLLELCPGRVFYMPQVLTGRVTGIPRHLFPCVSAPVDCERPLCSRQMDWGRYSYWGRVQRSGCWCPGTAQHGQEDALLWYHHIYAGKWQDYRRDGGGGGPDSSSAAWARSWTESWEGSQILARVDYQAGNTCGAGFSVIAVMGQFVSKYSTF